ncbi:hypothetical protein GYB61_12605 [bacterium]|nr:hypothetical protein [bacterium]
MAYTRYNNIAHLAAALATALLLGGCAGVPVPDGGDLIDRMRVDGGGLLLESEFGATPLSAPAQQQLRLGVIREQDNRNRFANHQGGSGLDRRRPPMRRTPIGITIDEGD